MPDKTLCFSHKATVHSLWGSMGRGGHAVDVGLVLVVLALSPVQIFLHIVSEQDQQSLYKSIKCSKRKKIMQRTSENIR